MTNEGIAGNREATFGRNLKQKPMWSWQTPTKGAAFWPRLGPRVSNTALSETPFQNCFTGALHFPTA